MVISLVKINENNCKKNKFVGHTEDYAEMIANLLNKYPTTRLVAVGFSLGGNLITKYLGESNKIKPDCLIGGISICQGYNAIEYVMKYFSNLYFLLLFKNLSLLEVQNVY